MRVARTLSSTLELRFDASEPLEEPPSPKLTNGRGACWLPGPLEVRRHRHRKPTARGPRASMVLGWS